MRTKILKISDIIVEDKYYPRVEPSESLIKEYAKLIEKGTLFPPIQVALFKKKYYLVDGNHRLNALASLGEDYVNCEVRTNFPSMDDIYIASIKANLKHGRRLTQRDKEKIALTMKEMQFKVEDIAAMTGISVKIVEKGAVKQRKANALKQMFSVPASNKSAVITEKIKKTESIKLIDEETEKEIEANRIINELASINDFFADTTFDLKNADIAKELLMLSKTLKKILNK